MSTRDVVLFFMYVCSSPTSPYLPCCSEKLTSSLSCFGEEETIQLTQLLTQLLGKSNSVSADAGFVSGNWF